jgi:L-aminopeptidase/D-esterase-like protein
VDSTGSIGDVPGILVGHAHDERALTGCTAILAPHGAVCGVDVRGAAPGTRETDLLAPTAQIERVHGVLLTGGSAFGLDAAGGVVAFLAEHEMGYDARGWTVPLVPAAVIFDLQVGDGAVRPDRAMGYAAAAAARAGACAEGNVGAGCGASVGKLAGMEHAMKGGLGTASVRLDDGLVVAALAVVNALGSVVDPLSGTRIAGPRAGDGTIIADDIALLLARDRAREAAAATPAGTNTTLVAVATNAHLSKAGVTRVALLAHDGIARAVFPAHLSSDGDVAFALSVGTHPASADLVGTLGAQLTATAIVRAVRAARPAGGLPAAAAGAL